MAKNENYANKFVELFNAEQDIKTLPYCETATVISPLPDLEIQLRNITYKKKNIKLDEYWVTGHKREIEIPSATLTGTDSDGDGHISGGFPEAFIIFKDELKAGDQVAVLQSKDKQTLYVLYRIARW